MAENLNKHQARRARSQPGLGRMLLISLGLHLVVLVLFSGVIIPRSKPPQRPVYVVDLMNLPVEKPQAGRPEAQPKPEPKPEAPKPEPKPEPAAVAPRVEPKPEPKPQPKPEPKPQPKATAAPKPEPKPASKPTPKPEPAQPSYDDAMARIEKMQREREREKLKASLDALASKDSRKASPVTDAPVGMPTGTGTEAGVSDDAWAKAAYTAAWTLSKYQVASRNFGSVEAEVLVIFDARGNLHDYRFLRRSGDERFDESVKRAVLAIEKYPREPGKRLELTIVFNLKELLEAK